MIWPCCGPAVLVDLPVKILNADRSISSYEHHFYGFVCLFVCCLGFFILETPLHAVSDKTYFTEVGTETKKAEQWIEDDNLG